MPMKPTHDEFIIAGETTLRYVQWGTQGEPIVCIHGLTANAFCFQAFADALGTDHRVFAYDLRGRGDSDKFEEGYSIPHHAEDLLEFLNELGIERPVLIGHSLGAMIALYFAAHHPDKLSKLVLVDAGAPLPWKSPEEQPAWLTAAISRLGTSTPSYKEYIDRLKMAPFLGPYWNEYIDIYFKHDVYPESNGAVTAKAYRAGILEEQANFNVGRPEEQWTGVRVPTLLLRAGQGLFSDNDQLMTEEGVSAARRAIANCQYINFPDLNHYTIIFGVDPGPANAIRTFIDQPS